MNDKRKVVVVGLDAADGTLIRKWIAQGHLPELAGLMEHGAQGPLRSYTGYSAELSWTTFLTGCSPSQTGYWSPILFDPDTYLAKNRGAYSFREIPPFFALGEDFKVTAFDLPQLRTHEDVNGPQVLAWGAHSPQTPTVSTPPELIDALTEQFGEHPGLHKDNSEVWEHSRLIETLELLRIGIQRRTEICKHLLETHEWDLFLTAYGETHSGGHIFWHLSQPDHPLHEVIDQWPEDPLLQVYKHCDVAIGELRRTVPNAHFIVFSGTGMQANGTDALSMFFLPELLHRYSFDGQSAIAESSGSIPAPEDTLSTQKSWSTELWSRKTDWNPLRRLARKYPGLSRRYFPIEQVFGSGYGPNPPWDYDEDLNFIPATWYANLWPKMTAFALPSFSDGYVRLNLVGREKCGIVNPDDYETELDAIERVLADSRCARTGLPILRETKRFSRDRDANQGDADLVAIWSDVVPDGIEHPKYGRIGFIPHRRSGSHNLNGFFVLNGPGITQSTLQESHFVNLPPTILRLMGATPPARLDGKPINLEPHGHQISVP